MHYVGIDIAKQLHVATILSSDGDVLVKPFKFSNDQDGFSRFLSFIKPFDKDDLILGLESTAHYCYNFVFFFLDLGYKITLINPLEISALRKSKIRKTKTDKIDSLLIAKFIKDNQVRLVQRQTIELIKLRSLSRFRHQSIKERTKVKIQLRSYVDQTFPELQYAVSSVHGKGCYALLKEAPAAKDVASMHMTHLANLLHRASHGMFNKKKAKDIRVLAQKSVGVKTNTLSVQIIQSIARIELLDKQIKDLESEIHSIMVTLSSVIMTIPGINFINGAYIISEIGDIERFSNSKQLIAFAGLDPVVSQSGNFRASNTRMSKRGSKYLRFGLINAAHNVVQNTQTFRCYYDQKRSSGLDHYGALGHVAGKLTRSIFKMIKENVEFNLE